MVAIARLRLKASLPRTLQTDRVSLLRQLSLRGLVVNANNPLALNAIAAKYYRFCFAQILYFEQSAVCSTDYRLSIGLDFKFEVSRVLVRTLTRNGDFATRAGLIRPKYAALEQTARP